MFRKSVKIQIFFVCLAVLFMSANSTMTLAQPKNKTKKPKTPIIETPVAPVAPEINFKVSMSQPSTHLLEVEMRLTAPATGNLNDLTELVLPVWTPGSYLVREYARHIQDFSARDTTGNALAWEKITKNLWQIQTKNVKELTVTYRVYSNELTVRTNDLNDRHAFWNNAALLMHPKGFLNAPSTLKIEPFGNWKIATGLEPDKVPNTFRAETFDELYDSPVKVADFNESYFEIKGIPHKIVIDREGNYDLPRMTNDIKKIAETQIAMFGGEIPYKRYVFIVNSRTGGGGLEHLNSQAVIWNRFGFKPESRYIAFLTLISHEFFHLWNVKRIRPDALGPFDYSNENYTKLLWVAEGATSYYENITMQRAGFVTDKQYLAERTAMFADLQRRPGRFQTSLEEASFDAWIKYYRQDENSINNQISYYDKGEIVSLLLDLEIRNATTGAKSLDDVFRTLYTDFFKKNKNFTPSDYQKTAETVAGKSLDEFFKKYVRGREEINYNTILNNFGVKLETAAPNAKEQTWLGADFAQTGNVLTIRSIASDTPAFANGLSAGDEVVAVDGFRANLDFLTARIGEKKPGDKMKLTLFRYDELRDFEVTLGARIPPAFRIATVENPTEAQKALYKGWLNMDLK